MLYTADSYLKKYHEEDNTLSTALWIDTTSRKLMIYAVSMTQVENGLVVRFGTEVGSLRIFTESGEFKNKDLPIIVDLRCYKSKESGGFVEVGYTPQAIRRSSVIGAMGMPWQGGTKSLRPITPIPVLVCGPTTNIIPVKRNYTWNLNVASAMYTGLKKVRQQMEPGTIFVTEGQRDYVDAWRLAASNTKHEKPFDPDWRQEHRTDMFTAEAMFKHTLKQLTWKPGITQMEQEGLMFLYLNVWAASESAGQKSRHFPCPEGMVENPAFPEFLLRMEQEGWNVDIELHSAHRHTKIVSPTGEEFLGPSLKETPKLEEAFI